MHPLSTAAANQLLRSHTILIRCTAIAWDGGRVADLPVIGGSVTCDSTSQVRRTGSIEIALASLWPDNPFEILSPLGSEMLIEYGIILPDGRLERVPLMQGPITSIQRTIPSTGQEAALKVTVEDSSSKVAEARFDQPTQTVAGATAVAEIKRLINEVLPGVGITDKTASTKINPILDMERDRWADGIEKIADSIGAEVYCNALGDFVIRPEPLDTDPVVWTFGGGDESIVVTRNDEWTRDLTYNRVVASGQRTDGTPPVYAIVSDTNPLSATYYGGPFGIKTRFFSSPLLTTVAQCTSAGNSLLARVRGNHLNVSLTNVTNPALEAGDVIRLRVGGTDTLHIIESVTIPLSPGTSQDIKTRSPAIPEETSAI
jgi:hypothetical protein